MDDNEYIRRELSKARPLDVEEKIRLKVESSAGESRWVLLPSEVYERVVATASGEDPAKTLRDLFERRWRCGVTASGYHNGAGCTPGDPHGDWGCGYRWIAPALTEKQAKELGLITEEKK